MREAIGLDDSLVSIAVKMGEGNPGALTVIRQLLATDNGMLTLLTLDDMNIRGSQIWVAFKDFAGGILSVMVAAVQARDPRLVDQVNAACRDYGEVAVERGGSFRSPPRGGSAVRSSCVFERARLTGESM